MYEAELEPWDYCTKLVQECEDIKITFQPISPPDLNMKIKNSQIETTIKADEQEKVEEVPLPKF